MTEDVKDAPSVDASEQQEQPAPAMPSEGSQPEGSAQPQDVSAIVEAATAKIKEELEGILDDKVDARFKSGKDRRFAKVDEIYQWVQAAGGNVDTIKSDLEISELRQQIAGLQSGPTGDAGTLPKLSSDWSLAEAQTSIILQDAGIAPDDSRYNALVEEYRGRISSKDWPDMVETFVKGRRGGSAAAVVSDSGGNAPASADQESIATRLMAATRTGDYATVEKLQKELTEAMKS